MFSKHPEKSYYSISLSYIYQWSSLFKSQLQKLRKTGSLLSAVFCITSLSSYSKQTNVLLFSDIFNPPASKKFAKQTPALTHTDQTKNEPGRSWGRARTFPAVAVFESPRCAPTLAAGTSTYPSSAQPQNDFTFPADFPLGWWLTGWNSAAQERHTNQLCLRHSILDWR